MLEQSFRRSSAQNRGVGSDVTLKSGELAAVPTAAAAVGVQKPTESVGRRTSVYNLRSPKLPTEQRYMTMHSYVWDACVAIGPRALSYLELIIADTKIVF